MPFVADSSGFVQPGPEDPPPEAAGTAWFGQYMAMQNVLAPPRDEPYTCPCCGHPTLSERGGYEICGECGWEDDGQDDHDSHVRRGGPNGSLSLDDARRHHVDDGGTTMRHVPPAPPRLAGGRPKVSRVPRRSTARDESVALSGSTARKDGPRSREATR